MTSGRARTPTGAAAAPTAITFVVPGVLDDAAEPLVELAASASAPDAPTTARRSRGAAGPATATTRTVRVGSVRAGTEPVRLVARPGLDVVVFAVANGPVLVLHPETARDLALSQDRGATRGSRETASDEIHVPTRLAWPGLEAAAATRAGGGFLGQAVLAAVQVLTTGDSDAAASWLASGAVRRCDGRVEAGVYALEPEALGPLAGSGRRLAAVPPAPDGGPLLVLVHGTFVDTASTFGKLWSLHADTVRRLFAAHGGRVYALDHPTLGASPIANARTLVAALPRGARLRLVTHSRGGLVAEVLARACAADADASTFAPGAYEAPSANAAGSGTAVVSASARALAAQRRDLALLIAEVRAKSIRVERIVRVAGPLRGTLLASGRLDAYLSVFRWVLQIAGVPVLPQLVELLGEVARRRADPAELPGLEAMLPQSALVAWLNGAGAPLESELRVIAGDTAGDSVASWTRTLLADAFFWSDHHLVVQTRSMYGGAARAPTVRGGAGARFLLDRGARVSHFTYFAADRTAAAVCRGVLEDEPEDFAAIGPLSWAGSESGGLRGGGAATPAAPTAKTAARAQRAVARGSRDGDAARPAVFVLPGILGSHLARDGHRIWLGPRFVGGLASLAWAADEPAGRILADGPIGAVYDALIAHLGESHAVVPFGFDWRRPIEEEAARLADALDAALALRAASGAPVRLCAHSMGGLVVRAMALERPATWQRLLARDGARVLFLGTPHAGSWSPMQTLSGDDTFGNTLAATGSLFDDARARRTMAGLPGFLQLQAGLLDEALGLERADTWQALADEDLARLAEKSLFHGEGPTRTVYRWGAPPQPVLDRAVALRRRLDAQAEAMTADEAARFAVVVGDAAATPAGFAMGADGLEYLDAPAGGGDGRVLHASALLSNVRAWRVAASHGDLPTQTSAFAGYAELLARGETARLEPFVAPQGLRGAAGPGLVGAAASAMTAPRIFDIEAAPSAAPRPRGRPSRGPQPAAASIESVPATPPSTAADVFASPVATAPSAATADDTGALHVTILNADLSFVHEPLVIGHYRSTALTGTERVVDRLVGEAMSRSLAAGLYPEAPGTQHIFGNVRQDPTNVLAMARPQAAIVAGLGEEGKLTAGELVATVRQAVLAYAQRLAEQPGASPSQFDIAATLLGSGGANITPGSSAQHVATGVRQAMARLATSGWPQVARLVLVEFYLDRATEAWRALQVLSTSTPNLLRLDGPVRIGAGAMRRTLDANYRGTAWDWITVLASRDAEGTESIVYNLDTRRARTEVRALTTQAGLVRELVAQGSNDANRDPQIGRTLWKLLVPVEMEPFLGGTTEMLIELDRSTAAIPWELLDAPQAAGAGADPRPWSIRSKLVRKLRTAVFRPQPRDATSEDSVLVIGEPLVDDPAYGPLPGARAEAEAVAERLAAPGEGVARGAIQTFTSASDDATTIVGALLERPYRVVHIAGHGMPAVPASAATADRPASSGGVVLSGGHVLGPAEVAAMRVVPELVFLNCCHLAARDARSALAPFDRTAFAANIAEALIGVGVRCVVAAGWAVEDRPAEVFATTFYDALLDGARFLDAAAIAREKAWLAAPDANTWAAYQCYGDPAWRWEQGKGRAEPGRAAPASTFRAAASPGAEFGTVASPVALTLALETISTGLRFSNDTTGSEARRQSERDRIRWLEDTFGTLWGAMGAVAEAFAVACADAGDLDGAIAWGARAVEAADGSASFRAAEQLGRNLARRGAQAGSHDAALADIDAGIARLERLVALQATAEREAALGGAHKRLVLVEERFGVDPRSPGSRTEAALRAMALHYGRAEALARADAAGDVHYPAKNARGAELRIAFLAGRPVELALEREQAVRDSLARTSRERPDFWTAVGTIELGLLAAVAARRLAETEEDLLEAFGSLQERIASPVLWDSVLADARFTLAPYVGVASAAERKAGEALLGALAAMAEAG